MAKTIRLKIDGIEVEVERGKMILDAAETAGVKIPTLCHDPKARPFWRLPTLRGSAKREERAPTCLLHPGQGWDGDHHPVP